jgi:Kef-type K+ transport system membrane component KefB
MKNIILLSGLLLVGLIASQISPSLIPANYYEGYSHVIKILTTVGLGFIMIRVGYEFDIDKNKLKAYGWDYVVAASAATLPWLFVAIYFIFVLSDANTIVVWKESLLVSRFASPTSAGILFSMLAAAGLAATWMYKKIRILAIFDDLDTVLLMVPLKMLLVGWKWQLGVVMAPMFIQLWMAWRYLHKLRIPITWPWVMIYTVIITLTTEVIYYWSKLIDEVVPIHIEVLLPAFVLGCMIVHKNIPNNKLHEDVLETPIEKRVTFLVSAVFILLVGLSMPAIVDIAGSPAEVNVIDQEIIDAYISDGSGDSQVDLIPHRGESPNLKSLPMSWRWIALHVIMITLISNLGKIFPLFCYRKEAHWKERLALAVGMFPRGEVGAGVLIISISYGIGGDMITVAMLSLALNLLLTGIFIVTVKKLLNSVENKISA